MAFWRLYYHLVWGTKNRQPLITSAIENHLYSYLIHKGSELGVFVYQINGWIDHIHLVVAIPPKLSIADVVKNLKGASSHFINDRQFLEGHFQWQRGYGVLSLGEKQRPFAEAYVINQKQHHQQQTTNTWLEHMTDYDEGAAEPESSVPILQEPAPIYVIDDERPF